MLKSMSSRLLWGTTALGLMVPFAAQAQGSMGFEEIVVTAQKRAENLQEVPIQVTAFTAAKVEDAGIKSTRDFVAMVPNMSFDESFTYLNSFVTIRGISQLNNADAPVAVVIDGVPQNSQKQFKMNLFDIERIEVLKGPQGALYGRNASGGAVNITTKQPTNDFEGFINGSYGNGDAIDLSGGISGPIIQDKVLFRIAGSYRQDDGRINNTFTNNNVDFVDHDYSVRGMIKVLASDNLTFDFRASYQDFQAGGLYDAPIFGANPLTTNSANIIADPQANIEGLTFGNIFEATFKFDYDMDFATLTGITGYTKLKEAYRGDLDFTSALGLGQAQDLDTKLLSQEIRLVSNADQAFRWIIGGFYIKTEKDLFTRAWLDVDGSRDNVNDEALRAITRLGEDRNNAYALFAQFDYDVVDNFTIQGALRYDRDKRKIDGYDNFFGTVTPQSGKKSFDAIQPKVTLTYKFDGEKLAYATYSTGFRSGGFNAPGVMPEIFEDETLQNFEAGFKTSWLNNRLIINGAVYFQKVDDFQIFFVDGPNAAQYLANIDKVDIFGVELEVQAMPIEGLELFGSIGTTDTEIKRNTLDPTVVGNQTPKNTKIKINLGFQYRMALADDLSGIIRMDYEHRGKKYWQLNNVDIQSPVDLINARAGIEGDTWGIYVWGKNLTNEEYYGDFNPSEYSGMAYDIGFRAQPRTYGVEARYKF